MQKYFWYLAVAMLAILGEVEITSMSQESQTVDESVHLVAGYSFLKTGAYWIAPEHPPLVRTFCALPLLLLKPELAVNDETYRNRLPGHFGKKFLYANRISADTMLFAARAMTVILTLLLGFAVALWCKKQFGPTVALLALLLFCLDPNITAHGRYVTTDMGVTLFFFLACVNWTAYLLTFRRRDLLLSGLTLGLALASKFSAIWLLPLFLILYAIRSLQRSAFSLRSCVTSFVILGGVAFTVLYATYAFETRPLISAKASIDPELSLAGKLKAKGDRAIGVAASAADAPSRRRRVKDLECAIMFLP
jgi:predicted membrane-bound dolichyl-phosphate-mannose-protein mannosyltransferase